MRITAAATASTTQVMLPVLLIGGLAALIRVELPAFDEARLGLTVSAFFAATALTSVPAGRFCERHGARLALLVAAAVATTAMLVFAVAPGVWWVLAASVVAGAANGVGQPAANLGLARGVRRRRQGLAFGMKQSAIPIAGLIAGLAVPLVGLTLGWRVTFALAAALAIPVVLLVPRSPATAAPSATPTVGDDADRPTPADDGGRPEPTSDGVGGDPAQRPVPNPDTADDATASPDAPRRALLAVSAAAGFGSAAANTLGAFLVLTVVAAGHDEGFGGYLLALGSLSGVITRLVVGWLADRRSGGHLGVVIGMLLVGTVAFAILASGPTSAAVLALATVIGFSAGWGWPGLLIYTVVRLHPTRPGAASGVMAAGAAIGGVLGPLAFGQIASRAGFAPAWIFAAGLALAAVVLLLRGRAEVRRAIAEGRLIPPGG